ncbi:MAG: hypothetical protein NT023_16980 [Armatimonadetes bacterium]|nr:hypothetical protein [Armatimonadota bacterium]
MNHSIESALDAPYTEDNTTPPLTDNAMRPSPRLDPVRRAMLSSLAKWMLLLAGLLLVGFLVGISRQQNSIGEGAGVSYYLAEHFISVLLATLVAMGLPLILLPRVFWQSEDLTDAARKWMITGIVTATLFYGSILLTRQYAREQIYRNVSIGVVKEITDFSIGHPQAPAKTPVDVLKEFADYNVNHLPRMDGQTGHAHASLLPSCAPFSGSSASHSFRNAITLPSARGDASFGRRSCKYLCLVCRSLVLWAVCEL